MPNDNVELGEDFYQRLQAENRRFQDVLQGAIAHGNIEINLAPIAAPNLNRPDYRVFLEQIQANADRNIFQEEATRIDPIHRFFAQYNPENERRMRRELMRNINPYYQPNPQRPPQRHQEFEQNQENTHDTSVTLTAVGSLKRLAEFYPNIDIEQCLREIEQHIHTFDYNSPNTYPGLSQAEKKRMVLEFWQLTQNRFDTVHHHTNLSTKQIVALVWTAVNDGSEAALTEELRHTVRNHSSQNSNFIVTTRKEAFIQKFIDAYLARRGEDYENGDICVGGAMHQILAILNKAHSQVIISTGDVVVKADANELAAQTVKEEFRGKSPREQRSMMRLLLDEEASPESCEFISYLKNRVDTKLSLAFGSLLSGEERAEIADSIGSVTIDLPLQNIIDEITQIPNDQENPARNEAILWLKHRANQAYRDVDVSFSDEAASQRLQLTAFQQLDEMMQKVIRVEINYTTKYRPNEKRLASIRDMKDTINKGFYAYSGRQDPAILAKIQTTLQEIRGAIQSDHKTGFFGKVNATTSNLLTCFDEEFSPN